MLKVEAGIRARARARVRATARARARDRAGDRVRTRVRVPGRYNTPHAEFVAKVPPKEYAEDYGKGSGRSAQ